MTTHATLEPAGDTAAIQTQGVVQQYGIAALTQAETSTGIKGYDSGLITGYRQPNQVSGPKLVDGTIQRATQLISSEDSGAVGNALVVTQTVVNSQIEAIPTLPAGENQSDGLSNFPGRE